MAVDIEHEFENDLDVSMKDFQETMKKEKKTSKTKKDNSGRYNVLLALPEELRLKVKFLAMLKDCSANELLTGYILKGLEKDSKGKEDLLELMKEKILEGKK